MHRIRRQILDIELPSGAGAGIWQQRIDRVFQEQVLPRLDAEFSRIAPPGQFVRIDRLEIDVGVFDDVHWETRFVAECIKQFTQKVVEAAAENIPGETPGQDKRKPEERMIEIFRYFLETGCLPWFDPKMPVREMEQMMLPIIRNAAPLFRHDFLQLFRKNNNALQRLIWQFSPSFAETALEAVLDLSPEWIGQVYQIAQSLLGRALRPVEKIRILSGILQNKPESEAQQQLPSAGWIAQMIYQSQGTSDEASSPGRPTEKRDMEHSPKDAESVHSGEPGTHTNQARFSAETGKGAMPSISHRELPFVAEENILVGNAGLVLVSVYLPAFFEVLKLTEGKNFTSLDQQYEGIHLLHFLATGEEFPEEPYLTLPKILCGLSPDEPVPSDIRLSEQAKNESTRLLQAVIRNWSVLKNTGPEGLRNAFLQRAGLLGWSEDRMAWLLRAERQAQDLLLDRLPWSYSVVKLPWMPEMLQVEW